MSEINVRTRDARAIPYRGEQPFDMRPDLLVPDLWPAVERLWVPLDEGVWSRPLLFNVTQGSYSHLMRVTRQGTVARHRPLRSGDGTGPRNAAEKSAAGMGKMRQLG